MSVPLQLAGLRFGRLSTIRPIHKGTRLVKGIPRRRLMWECKCDCGRITAVDPSALKLGLTRSCGRLLSSGRRTHGLSSSREYGIWRTMIDRCSNPKNHAWSRYGGRGISVCARWRDSFESFYEDMGPRPSSSHSLDRYPNNDGNYEPGNVRWATYSEQAQNTANCVFLEVGGVSRTISAWARIIGVTPGAISFRLKRGMSVEDAVTTPKGEAVCTRR